MILITNCINNVFTTGLFNYANLKVSIGQLNLARNYFPKTCLALSMRSGTFTLKGQRVAQEPQ